MAAIIASVAPQVTVTWVSGSIAPQPGKWRGGRGRDRVAQRLAAPGDRVLVDVVVDGRRGGVLELGRAREVGEALGEADRAGRHRQPVHLADDRFAEALGLGRDPRTCHGAQSSRGGRTGQTRRRSIVSRQARRKNGSPSTSTSRSTVRWNALGVAGLGRAGPDLGLEGVLAPAVDDVGVEDRARGIGVGGGHRQRLGRVEPATVVEDVLAAVVDRDRHGAGDDVVRDPPDRLVRAAFAADMPGRRAAWS